MGAVSELPPADYFGTAPLLKRMATHRILHNMIQRILMASSMSLPIIATAMLMAACSKDTIVASVDPVTPDSGNSICFNVGEDSSPASTRAEQTAFDTSKQFRVYAWNTSDETNPSAEPIIGPMASFESSNIVSYDKSLSVWSTIQKYYWPDETTSLTFYAYYPQDAPFVASTRAITYSVTPVDGFTDLLYAKTATSKENSEFTGVSNSYSALINFRHAFCRVDFKANITNTDLKVVINSLQICNVNAHGTFNYPSGSTNTENAETDYGAWPAASLSAPTTYTVGITTPVTLTAADTQLGTTNPYLLLIPQTLTPWDPSVTIAANDANATPGCYLKIGCSITISENEYSDNGYVYCPLTPDWQPANNYTYTLSFGGGYDSVGRPVIQPIVVTTAIKPWNTTTGIDKTIY